MDSLPPEIKLKIFNQLSIRDSIKCRQVCKDWLTIIDCLRYTSLDFRVSSIERSDTITYGKKIDLWILNFEKFFRSVIIDPKFSRIKVMNDTGSYLSEVENLDVLINHFKELEVLNLLTAPEKLVINLKFLKKLNFNYPPNEVKLETPSLTHLITERISNFEICYPEQIKYLDTQLDFDFNKILIKFKNLEILIINYSRNISQLPGNLNRFPQLKRIYIGYDWHNLNKRLEQIPIDRHSKLQVYYYGFRINSDLFGNYDWTNIKNSKEHYDEDGEWTSFMARNYSTSIDDNPYTFNLDYTRLFDEFGQNVPNDFFKKISKFDTIRIRNLDDEAKILKFLDSSKPASVCIENPTLSRSFLEQLSNFSFIDELNINIDEWPAFLDDFNFDFENEKIDLEFEIRCSLKSLRTMFEVFERAGSIKFELDVVCDEFRFVLHNSIDRSQIFKTFLIDYFVNDEIICTDCIMESLDFCFYLDRQVPSIVELKDKFRLFFIVDEYKEQETIAELFRRKLYLNPTISIKF